MMPHVIRNEKPAYYDPESTLVMDSKGLFDALNNDLPQDDRKSALEVPIIEEFMRRTMCRLRWCSHNRNAAACTSCLHFNSIVSMTFFAFWVHSEASSANDNNTCSEVSHHGSFDSIVMMYCVSVPVLSEHNMSIPGKSLMKASRKWLVSAKRAIGPSSSAHNLHGDWN